MPIREESYDLFGSSNGTVYSYDKAISTSADGSITGNALDLRADAPAKVAEYRVFIDITTACTGLTSLSAKIQHSADNGSSDAYADLVAGGTVLAAAAVKGKRILEVRLPANCKRWIKAVVTNVGTATAGKVGGNVEAIV